ncbi:MAG: hypothetical protein ACSHX3_15070 [Litorimonas sp.]
MQAILLLVSWAGSAAAESCYPPERPFVPSDPQSAKEFADIIRGDFELYIRDVQGYFRCLDDERSRAFEEAREVSQEYGQFLQTVGE